ncbi:MAG: hypothetical protein LBR79_06480 [Oscillospiraceae bacterium]|jgi:phenylacetate-CoA ligase|nr:hypothetical protein [Oscillospiraceae bacterium]
MEAKMLNIHELESLPIYKDLLSEKSGKKTYNDYPQLLKSDIAKNFPNNFTCHKLENAFKSKQLEFTTTSGTTSDKMQIIRKKDWWKEEYNRVYSQVPILSEKKEFNKVIFTTAICSSSVCHIGKTTMKQRISGNILYVNTKFDPFSFTPEDINRIIDEINFFKPYYIEADAVYLSIFLMYKKKYNISKSIHKPKIITLSYEFSNKNIKKYLKKYFNCPVLDFYGSTEFGYAFLENKDGNMKMCKGKLQVNLDPLNASKNLYVILISSEKNEFMPLFNYRSGDIAEVTQNQLKNFDSDPEISRIVGRERDITFDKNNEIVTVANIDDFVSTFDNIILYQLEFFEKEKIIFRYVTYDFSYLSDADKNKISNFIYNLYAIPVDILYQICIPPEISGKFSIIKKCC